MDGYIHRYSHPEFDIQHGYLKSSLVSLEKFWTKQIMVYLFQDDYIQYTYIIYIYIYTYIYIYIHTYIYI